MVPLHNIDFDVVKVQKLYDITKPWLEKVGALRINKEDVPILTHPLAKIKESVLLIVVGNIFPIFFNNCLCLYPPRSCEMLIFIKGNVLSHIINFLFPF